MRRAKNKPRQGGHTKWWLGLNLFAIAILLLTYITPWISVNRWGWLSLLALAYPFTLFVNILFVFGWFFFKNRFALLSLLALAVGWKHHGEYIQLFPGGKSDECVESIRILSYNLRGLSLFPGGPKTPASERIDTLYESLAAHKEFPDILCLQEATYGDLIAKRFEMEHIVHVPRSTLWLISRYPIVAEGNIEGSTGSPCAIWADIKSPQGTFRVINIHLTSNRVSATTQELMQEMTQPSEQVWKNLRFILSRYKATTRKRAREARVLREFVLSSSHPVILAGDANDPPLSNVFSILSGDMHNSFIRRGAGLSTTYDGPLPLLRIDYIFGDRQIDFKDHQTYPLSLSDHFPVAAGFCLKQGQE